MTPTVFTIGARLRRVDLTYPARGCHPRLARWLRRDQRRCGTNDADDMVGVMILQPCAVCRRHIDSRGAACPFCGEVVHAPARGTARMIDHAARLSRSVVFAGAAACYTNAPPATNASPPPPPGNEHVVAPPSPPPPDGRAANGGTFTKPPANAVAVIRGRVRKHRVPLADVVIDASNGPDSQTMKTDAAGNFEFTVVPGRYRMIVHVTTGTRFPPPQPVVEVGVGEARFVDLEVMDPSTEQAAPCCKPYGAPPARRRVV